MIHNAAGAPYQKFIEFGNKGAKTVYQSNFLSFENQDVNNGGIKSRVLKAGYYESFCRVRDNPSTQL